VALSLSSSSLKHSAVPLLLVENLDGIRRLTLNHPEKRNALSRALLQALADELGRIQNDRSIRIVILRAAEPVFSAGHDLRELASTTEAENKDLFALCTRVMEGLRLLPQPVIAEVDGLATAAGCQLVASCDLVMASDKASFATPGVKIGLFCTTPGVAVARAVMTKKALEMLFTGSPITAADAERYGLVNHVVPSARLAEATLELARQIMNASSSILALGKHAFYRQIVLDRPEAYCLAEKVMVQNLEDPGAREGITAFLEKRSPRWPELKDEG
jgi:enoyl-CoA hydratase/carnithine racemase